MIALLIKVNEHFEDRVIPSNTIYVGKPQELIVTQVNSNNQTIIERNTKSLD